MLSEVKNPSSFTCALGFDALSPAWAAWQTDRTYQPKYTMLMTKINPLERLSPTRFDDTAIFKKLASTSRQLAEPKGIAASIPNQGILISTLGLQDAKDSSAIENIITTHDEIFKDEVLPDSFTSAAAKEVLRYRQALRVGFEQKKVQACSRPTTSSKWGRNNYYINIALNEVLSKG
jgi:Fic/DOC family N-terminal